MLKGVYRSLDPLVQVEVKCLISTIGFDEDGAFLYAGRPITQVEIVGVIVRRHAKDSRLLIHVDDGTGVVGVLIWAQRFEREPVLPVDQMVVGETVVVRGALSWYRAAVQIQARAVGVLRTHGVLREIAHWHDVACQHGATVDCQVRLSADHRTEIDVLFPPSTLVEDSQQCSVSHVMGCICSMLASSPNGELARVELNAQLSPCHPAKVEQALTALCHQGTTYHTSSTIVEIRPDGNLARCTLPIIYQHKHIDFNRLTRLVRQDPRFSRVESDVLQLAVRFLESTEENLYVDGDVVKVI